MNVPNDSVYLIRGVLDLAEHILVMIIGKNTCAYASFFGTMKTALEKKDDMPTLPAENEG